MNITGGEAVVEVLRNEKVKKVFGVPGESYLPVLDAFYATPDIEFISARQEGGASFMAEGYAKSTLDVGVCMATRGPGATNLSIGIHTAQQDSTPLVALIGQVERAAKNKEAFQEVDLPAFFQPIAKWTLEIERADSISELLHRAFHIAASGRPGPVVVSLPEDVLEEYTTYHNKAVPEIEAVPPGLEQIQQAAEKIEQASKPVIIAGGGVIWSQGQNSLVSLAEKLSIPVASAFRRFTVFPNSHPNYIGALGLGAPSYLLDYIKESDVVVALGTRLSQVTTANYTLLDEDATLIHIDQAADTYGKSFSPDLAIQADARLFTDLLAQVVSPDKDNLREDKRTALNKAYHAFSDVKKRYTKNYVDMEGMMYDLMEKLPNDTIVTNDAGNFFSWLSRYYKFNAADVYIGPTAGAMGYGLPAAIGAKIANPDRMVVSFSGDGGFMMTMQEFQTAVRYQVPVLAIVINNSLYGTIRAHQENKFPGRQIATNLSEVHFTQIATSMGGYGERVEKNEDFIPAIERALNTDKPALIEVITDPEILTAHQPLRKELH
ncbi:MAG TPA: thiamine pyrophosphate-dependent enzyme [Pseudogracilibacillus sp.]|nr:thiamine pyrophosphate-dependent enzyme [Pseudogracilibacillus sp.]